MSYIPQPQSRRDVLRSSLRYLALGGISLLSAGLIARGTISPGAACCRPSACGDCAAMARCKLPPALAAKRLGKR